MGALALAAAAVAACGYATPSFVTVGAMQATPAQAPSAAPRVQQPRLSVAAVGVATAMVGLAASRLTGNSVAMRRPRTSMRALQEIGSVKLNLVGGKATPAPPVGPALGQFGVNIAMFVKEYNAMTADKVGQVCPVVLHVFNDKSFSLELKTPPTAELLHKAVGAKGGSGKAGTMIIGTINIDKLREIAEIKLPDLNCEDVERAMKIVHGTAVASGIDVEGYDAWLKTIFPPPATILDRYGPKKAGLPAPWGEGKPLADAPVAEPAEA
jgi:large subunit ribosomal protein L11